MELIHVLATHLDLSNSNFGVPMTAKKRALDEKGQNGRKEGLFPQMGHILYMAQLSGSIDKKDLLDTLPKPEKEMYKQAFEVLIEEDVLQVLTRGEDQFFSLNPDRTKEANDMISGFVRGTKSDFSLKHTPSNPFFHRGPIKDMDHFIGRSDVISHIFDRLRHTEDCSIIGPRTIGKSSLLHFITHPEIMKQHHLNPQKYIFVYCDLQRFGEGTQKQDIYFEMYTRLFSQITLGGYLKEEEVLSLLDEGGEKRRQTKALFEIANLEALIGIMSEREFKIVFEFDEFESISGNPNFDFSFYGQLRSFSGNPNLQVAFVTSSKQSLYDLTFDTEIKTSPFFRYFEDFRLGLMTVVEMNEFFDMAARNGAAFDSYITETIARWSGGHPFLIQLACDYFFDLVTSGASFRRQDAREHLQMFLKKHNKHFAYLWSQMDKKQQACMWGLASGKPQGADCQEEFSALEDIFLVVSDRGKYRIFSSAFESFIQNIQLFG